MRAHAPASCASTRSTARFTIKSDEQLQQLQRGLLPVDLPDMVMRAQFNARIAFAGQRAGMHPARRLDRGVVVVGQVRRRHQNELFVVSARGLPVRGPG
jgi:hypothetical protein